MPGYNWKGWAIIFYFFSAAFVAFGASDAASWGLTTVQHKWLLMVLGALAGVGAKMGESFAGKSETGNGTVSTIGRLLIPFVLAPMLLSGCAAKQYPTLPPESQKQLDATEVAKRVVRLMDATIAAEAQGAIPTVTARRLVKWSVEALKILQSYPAGYGPALAQTWRALKTDPTIFGLLAQNPYVSAAAALIDVALAMWQAPEPMELIPCWL